jgi:hypothetical protein
MSEYADWPALEELRRVLNVDPGSTVHDTTLGRVLEAAIAQVKADIGKWDDLLDMPTPKLAQAALRMAELMALTPEAAAAASADPTYRTLLRGHLRRFAIS